MKLVLATRNQGKVRELAGMLRNGSPSSGISQRPTTDNQGIEVISLKSYPDAPEVVEDGATYAENAIKKASVIAQYTGHLTLADDAGLEVNALNGAPGIHSKRWVGEDATDAQRIAGLLEALEGVTDRRARFVAAIAIVHPEKSSVKEEADGTNSSLTGNYKLKTGNCKEVVVGVCEGRITYAPAGESGFGYDPIFVPDGHEQTFAELGENIKNQMSHRAKALQQALALI